MNIRQFAIAVTLITAAAWVAIATSYSRSAAQPDRPTETAVFSGGCFWGLQAAFAEVEGVVSSRVGYTGGDIPNPTYTKVVFGKTGHAEAVEIVFDPTIVSFADLLAIHIDRVKTRNAAPSSDDDKHHSRAAVFVQSEVQRELVTAKFLAAKSESKFLLTEDASIFWEAEAEHQNYLANCVD